MNLAYILSHRSQMDRRRVGEEAEGNHPPHADER